MLKCRYKSYALILLYLSMVSLVNAAVQRDYFAPEHVAGAVTVTAKEAKDLFDTEAVFVDVRAHRLFKRKHIPNAHHLDLKKGFSKSSLENIAKKHEPLVIYSSSIHCSRSYKAVAKAVSWGYTQVKYFRGGIVEWKKKYPLQFPEN